MPKQDTRYKDSLWEIPTDLDGKVKIQFVQTALLMDIRDELKTLNKILGCRSFIDVPKILREIRRNTNKPKRKKK